MHDEFRAGWFGNALMLQQVTRGANIYFKCIRQASSSNDQFVVENNLTNDRWTSATAFDTNVATIYNMVYSNIGSGDNYINDSTVNGAYYISIVKFSGDFSNSNGTLMMTSGLPDTITAVSQPADTYAYLPSRVKVTLNAALNAQESVILRWSIDNFTTSYTAVCTSENATTYYADIPGFAAGVKVKYYAFTTTVPSGSDSDLFAISYDNNNGSNYSFKYLPPPITYHSVYPPVGIWPAEGGRQFSDSETLRSMTGATGFLTWDTNYVYVAFTGGTVDNDKYNLLIDTNPGSPVGSTGSYSGRTFANNFRPDVAYQFQSSVVWRQYSDGANGWTGATDVTASCTTGFSYNTGGGTQDTIIVGIPWSNFKNNGRFDSMTFYIYASAATDVMYYDGDGTDGTTKLGLDYWMTDSGMVIGDSTAPSAPTVLTIYPVRQKSTDSFTVSWTASGDPTGIAGYFYTEDTSPGVDTDGAFVKNDVQVSSVATQRAFSSESVTIWAMDRNRNVSKANALKSASRTSRLNYFPRNVVINEALVADNTLIDPGDVDSFSFIELYNDSTASIDVSNWVIADTVTSWTMPAGTTLGAGKFLVQHTKVGAAPYTDSWGTIHLFPASNTTIFPSSTFSSVNTFGLYKSSTFDSANIVDFVAFSTSAAGTRFTRADDSAVQKGIWDDDSYAVATTTMRGVSMVRSDSDGLDTDVPGDWSNNGTTPSWSPGFANGNGGRATIGNIGANPVRFTTQDYISDRETAVIPGETVYIACTVATAPSSSRRDNIPLVIYSSRDTVIVTLRETGDNTKNFIGYFTTTETYANKKDNELYVVIPDNIWCTTVVEGGTVKYAAQAAADSIFCDKIKWYLNDGSLTGDSYCSAVGNDANDGLSPATPKLTLGAVLPLMTPGDILYIDSGTFTPGAQVTINETGILLAGVDSSGSIIDMGGVNEVQIQTVDSVTFRNLQIKSPTIGIDVSNADSFTADNVRITNAATNGMLLNTGSNNATIRSCYIYNAATHGINVNNGSRNNLLRDNWVDKAGAHGILLSANAESNTLINNRVERSTNIGIVVDNSSFSTVDSNTCYSNQQIGIQLASATIQSNVRWNTIDSNLQIGIQLSSATNDTILSNSITRNQQMGVQLVSASNNNVVIGNSIDSNVQDGVRPDGSTGNVISNNRIRYNIQNGIYVFGASTGTYIFQNEIDSNTQYAVRMDAVATGCTITKNVLTPKPGDTSTVFIDPVNTSLIRNYWNTTDTNNIRSRILGGAAGTAVYIPFRNLTIDTTMAGDSVAPKAPDTCAAVGYSPIEITVSWQPSTVDEEADPFATNTNGYKIYRSKTTDTIQWILRGTVGGSTLTYLDSNCVRNETYYYKITAYDNNANRANEASFADTYCTGVVLNPANYANIWYVNDATYDGNDSFCSAVGADGNSGYFLSAPFLRVESAVAQLSTGDTIYIDGGTFTPSDTIKVETGSVWLIGVDSGKTTISFLDSSQASLKGIQVKSANFVTIRDLGVRDACIGVRYLSSDTGIVLRVRTRYDSAGILLDQSKVDSVTNCWSQYDTYGIWLKNVDSSTLTGNRVTNGVKGYWLSSGSDTNVLTSNYAGADTNDGFLLDASSFNALNGNTAETVVWAGFSLINGSARNLLASNTATNDTGQGIWLQGSGTNNNTIRQNTVTNSGDYSIYVNADTNTFTQNTCNGGAQMGYYVFNAVGNRLESNTVYGKANDGYSFDGSSFSTVVGNTSRGNGDVGFLFFNASNANYVAGNTAETSTNDGFLLQDGGGGGSNNNHLRRNVARNNGGAGIKVLGSNDNVIEANESDSNASYSLSVNSSAARNVYRKNIFLPRPSDTNCASTDTADIDLLRNYWGTTDSSAIRGRIMGTARLTARYMPFRLGANDTAAANDTVAPKAPDTVAAQALDSSRITVTWKPSTTAEEPEPALALSGYRVYRARYANTTQWTLYYTADSLTLSFTDSGLALDTSYCYRVTAFDTLTPYGNEAFYSDSIAIDTTFVQPDVLTCTMTAVASTYFYAGVGPIDTGTANPADTVWVNSVDTVLITCTVTVSGSVGRVVASSIFDSGQQIDTVAPYVFTARVKSIPTAIFWNETTWQIACYDTTLQHSDTVYLKIIEDRYGPILSNVNARPDTITDTPTDTDDDREIWLTWSMRDNDSGAGIVLVNAQPNVADDQINDSALGSTYDSAVGKVGFNRYKVSAKDQVGNWAGAPGSDTIVVEMRTLDDFNTVKPKNLWNGDTLTFASGAASISIANRTDAPLYPRDGGNFVRMTGTLGAGDFGGYISVAGGGGADLSDSMSPVSWRAISFGVRSGDATPNEVFRVEMPKPGGNQKTESWKWLSSGNTSTNWQECVIPLAAFTQCDLNFGDSNISILFDDPAVYQGPSNPILDFDYIRFEKTIDTCVLETFNDTTFTTNAYGFTVNPFSELTNPGWTRDTQNQYAGYGAQKLIYNFNSTNNRWQGLIFDYPSLNLGQLSALEFRIRLDTGTSAKTDSWGNMDVKVRSAGGAELSVSLNTYIPNLGPDWRRVRIPVNDWIASGFDPTKFNRFIFAVANATTTTTGSVLLDDVQWVKGDTTDPAAAPTLTQPGNNAETIPRPSLKWATTTDNNGSVNYYIEIARDSDFVNILWRGHVSNAGETSPPYDLSGKCWWRVAAYDPSGNWTAFSDSSSFRVDAAAPAKPTGLTAIAAITGADTGVRISWNNNTETDLVGYRVYRYGSNDSVAASTLLFGGLITDTSRIDTSALPGETYYYFVSAYDSNGQKSDTAGGVSATAFTIVKAIDSTSFGLYPGSTMQYSLTFRNAGWSPADSVIIYDTIPSSLAFRDTVTNLSGWEFQYATIASPNQTFYSTDYTSGTPGAPSSVRFVRWRKLLVTSGEPQAVIRYRVYVQ